MKRINQIDNQNIIDINPEYIFQKQEEGNQTHNLPKLWNKTKTLKQNKEKNKSNTQFTKTLEQNKNIDKPARQTRV